MAPGSSIMPGKVNPVIPEIVNQIAFQVVGQVRKCCVYALLRRVFARATSR
eukprot:COSAG05_NODE_466_length_9533_cov_5.547806_7_plen_51_part_00